jgi:hypothetical protein
MTNERFQPKPNTFNALWKVVSPALQDAHLSFVKSQQKGSLISKPLSKPRGMSFHQKKE